MVIEGKTNLERTKRALISYTVYCAQNALRADEKTSKDYWDPELKATEELLKAVDVNLERSQKDTENSYSRALEE